MFKINNKCWVINKRALQSRRTGPRIFQEQHITTQTQESLLSHPDAVRDSLSHNSVDIWALFSLMVTVASHILQSVLLGSFLFCDQLNHAIKLYYVSVKFVSPGNVFFTLSPQDTMAMLEYYMGIWKEGPKWKLRSSIKLPLHLFLGYLAALRNQQSNELNLSEHVQGNSIHQLSGRRFLPFK